MSPTTRQESFLADQRAWLAAQFAALTVELDRVKPSTWAEQKRYLPPQVTPLPGLYSFDVAPYVREILDCMDPDSPVREVAWMKGAQIAATTGALENAIGYYIEHVKNAPMMMVTADADLAQMRMDSYVTPMLQHSELMHLVKSADESNRRKTGKTSKRVEWIGGGFLVPFGAQNANKLRSLSIQVLLGDEVDGWPMVVGVEGDPVALVKKRTSAYESSRKELWLSTPTIKGQSRIEEMFRRGDQRRYFVRCLRCEFSQVLRWSHVDESGTVSGIVWETQGEGGRLVPGSVRYLCQHCGHPHTDDDKIKLLSPDNGAEWRPTAEPAAPEIRSYHLSALYSPAGMQTWTSCVQQWLEAWDADRSRVRDVEKLQVFYNTVLGESFELHGDHVRFENVSAHRRHFYRYGEVRNRALEQHCGGPALIVTCAADVHKDSLKVATFAWCRDRRGVLLDYWTLEGVSERVDDPGTWGALREIIERKQYVADDGKRYPIQLTLVDSGYLTDQVYEFCGEYRSGVHPIKGQDVTHRSVRVPEFAEFKNARGLLAFGITVDLYKDRWSAALRSEWSGEGLQPNGHFNAPLDVTDAQLKELTAEVKREVIDKRTGKRLGVKWHRVSGRPNELWDLLVYNNAALDLIARDWSQNVAHPPAEFMDWGRFWQAAEGGLYFGAAAAVA